MVRSWRSCWRRASSSGPAGASWGVSERVGVRGGREVWEAYPVSEKWHFFVFSKGLRAQRAGRVAPRRGGAKRRAAALGAAQRRKAPPQAAERRAPRKACFSAFNFPPIIEKQKMLTGTSAGIRPILRPRQSLGTELHVYHVVYLIFDLQMCGLLPTVPIFSDAYRAILQLCARASKSILLRSA